MLCEKEWDAVVIGAGPAGASFSKRLAEKGFKVLMVERKKELGVPVRCGEGVADHVWEELTTLKPHPDWSYRIKGAYVISPSGKEHHYDYAKGYVVERRIFDKLLTLQAVDSGAKLLTGTTATRFGKNSVRIEKNGEKTNLKTKLVIGADGVESYVARMKGLAKNIPLHKLASCFQYEMKGINLIKPHHLELYFGSHLSSGYIWIFPKEDDRANVGIGITSNSEQTAKKVLDAFINQRKDLKNASITQSLSGTIPISQPLKKFVKDNTMIIGTAARQVNPMHGGGIGEAMEAGQIAAETAAKALESNDLSEKQLKEYETKWKRKYETIQTSLYKLRKIIDKFNDEDLEYYMNNLKPELIQKMHTPQGILKIMKFFLKKPKIGAILKGLLS